MGEGKILLIMLLALIVLGPEKLPRLAADIGRWVGRARALARQLTTQLDQEVRLEEIMRDQRTHNAANPMPAAQPPPPGDTTHADVPGPATPAPDYASAAPPVSALQAAGAEAPAPVAPATPATQAVSETARAAQPAADERATVARPEPIASTDVR